MRISDWSSDVCSSDLPMSESTSDLPEGGTFDRLKAKAKQVAGEVLDRGDLAAEGRLEEASIERADEAREQVAEAERAETEAELDRTSGVEGQSVSVRGDLGCRRINKKKK